MATTIVAALAAAPAQAQAAGAPGPKEDADAFTTWRSSRFAGKYWDVQGGGTGNGAKVILFNWTGGDNQLWISHWSEAGTVAFENYNSGRCAEDNGYKYNVQVDQWDCRFSGQGNMRWSELGNGSGAYVLENHGRFQEARAVNGKVMLANYNSSDAGFWWL